MTKFEMYLEAVRKDLKKNETEEVIEEKTEKDQKVEEKSKKIS
jgi:hypothetical protein